MRTKTPLTLTILAAGAILFNGSAAGETPGSRAADGVAVDGRGNPLYATFSLCAVDRETGEAGAAVTTRVPFVGRAVPWVRAGVGAVATQAWTVVEYGRRGLDLMEEGLAPDEVLERLLADDNGREERQLGLIDMEGRTAAHTGAENGEWAGSRQGTDYTVQGNILVGPEVIAAVAESFEATATTGMPLAERMILALEAGQEAGGDRRWGRLQSSALRVADPNEYGRGGDRISVAIDVGEHERPVAEMKRIYYRTQRRLGYRELSEIQGPDVVELKRMLHALGYWGEGIESFPEPPELTADRSRFRSDPEGFLKAIAEHRERSAAYDAAWALYDEAAIAAVEKFRQDHGLVYAGNPRGLVDRRFVEALREAYFGREKEPARRPTPRGGASGADSR